MRINPEIKNRAVKWGKRSVVALGALGLATVIGPMAIEGISASNAKTAADFQATGGSNIERVGETNLYTIRPNSSASEARSKAEVMNKALIQIAKSNPGCELSTPWQIPLTTQGRNPLQLEELYYLSVYCPQRISN